MVSITEHAHFCVTLVDFDPAQASDFEDALRQIADTFRITVRRERSVSQASYPKRVTHAIVFTPNAIIQLSKRDEDTLRSVTNVETCRIYLSDAEGLSALPQGRHFDEFIQQTQVQGYTSVANEIISFFREAYSLNRHSTLLAFRDMTCLVSYRILKYLWPVSYVFASVLILNATTALTGRGAWIGQYVNNDIVFASTFFGTFFIAHCITTIVRNWLFAVRIAKRSFSWVAWGVAGFGMASAATAYSVTVIEISISRISVSAILAVLAYAFYMYARRIRCECSSLSEFHDAMVDPQRRENMLKYINRQRFSHSAFPVFPFRNRALFISYMQGSEWSSDTAALVRQWASKNGQKVFLDRFSISSGSVWRRSLLRAVSECGFFVAVIDGNTTISEWALAESAYAANLRKNIGKPRILLVVQNAQRIAEDKQNPIQLLYLDVFQLPPAICFGAAILPVDGDHQLTEERFFKALEAVRPMCLLS